jgi:hypothetical protein
MNSTLTVKQATKTAETYADSATERLTIARSNPPLADEIRRGIPAIPSRVLSPLLQVARLVQGVPLRPRP